MPPSSLQVTLGASPVYTVHTRYVPRVKPLLLGRTSCQAFFSGTYLVCTVATWDVPRVICRLLLRCCSKVRVLLSCTRKFRATILSGDPISIPDIDCSWILRWTLSTVRIVTSEYWVLLQPSLGGTTLDSPLVAAKVNDHSVADPGVKYCLGLANISETCM